jgi:hypothetical protein
MDIVIADVANGLLSLTNAQLLSKGEIFNDLEQTQIKVGKLAGVVQADNSIIINATGTTLNNDLSTDTDSCFIKPIKSKDATSKEVLLYNTTTGEVTSTPMGNISSGSESVAITGATASDTWTITTNNTTGTIYPQVTCALDPAAASGLVAKQSPIFTSASTITTSAVWPVGTGWLISASSFYEGVHFPWYAADSETGTTWTSATNTFSGGVGDQYWQIQYPSAVNVLSFKFDSNANSGASAPTTFSLSYSDDNINWSVAQNYTVLASVYSATPITISQTVPSSGSHRYFRIRVTRNAGLTYVQMNNIQLFTGFTAAGLKLSSVLPISSSQFKLVMTDVLGTRLSPANIPISLPFYITLIKAGKIVNTGLYTISTTGVISTA